MVHLLKRVLPACVVGVHRERHKVVVRRLRLLLPVECLGIRAFVLVGQTDCDETIRLRIARHRLVLLVVVIGLLHRHRLLMHVGAEELAVTRRLALPVACCLIMNLIVVLVCIVLGYLLHLLLIRLIIKAACGHLWNLLIGLLVAVELRLYVAVVVLESFHLALVQLRWLRKLHIQRDEVRSVIAKEVVDGSGLGVEAIGARGLRRYCNNRVACLPLGPDLTHLLILACILHRSVPKANLNG